MRTHAGLLLMLSLLAGCSNKDPEGRAMTPRDSIQAMHFSEDFHAELFAAEPDVMSPVEMAFDENGKVYVAEMMDYPEDPPAGSRLVRASACSKTSTAMARRGAVPSSPRTSSPSADSCRGRAG